MIFFVRDQTRVMKNMLPIFATEACFNSYFDDQNGESPPQTTLEMSYCPWISEVWHKFYCYNNTGNVRITQQWCAFTKPLLLWKSNKYYIFLCVHERKWVMCVHVCGYRCMEAGVCYSARVALLIQHATLRHIVIWGPFWLHIVRHYRRHDFRKNVTEHKMCVFISNTNFA
jgi:hypothetical protein